MRITKRIEDCLILLLILVCSTQSFFAKYFSFADEVIEVILFMYVVLFDYFLNKKKKLHINKNTVIITAIFILLTMLNVFIKKYNFMAYLEEILNYFKFLLILEMFKLIEIDNQRIKKFLNFFIIITVISCLYGLYRFYIKTSYISGDMHRNGKLRIAGFSGHPITLAFSSLTCVAYLMNNLKKSSLKVKIIKIFLTGFFIYCIFLTQSRLVLFFLVMYFIYRILFKIYEKSINKKKTFYVLATLSLSVILIIALTFSSNIKGYLKGDIEDTIRFFSMKKVFEILPDNFLLGTGIGTFSCRAASKYYSYVYTKYDFSQFYEYTFLGDCFESQLAKILIQTGVLGFLFYYYFLMKNFKLAKKNELLIYLYLILFIEMIFNPIYQIPYAIILAIVNSNNYFIKNNNK